MNKKFILFIIFMLLVFVVAGFVLENITPKILFEIAQKYSQNKEYEKADKYFSACLLLRKTNSEYRYFYVKNLTQLPTNQQKKIYEFSQLNITDSADFFADSYIENVKNEINETYGETYIQKAPYKTKIIRWSKSPINVFIDKSNEKLPEYFYNNIEMAFIDWAKKTKLEFKFVNELADINVRFSNERTVDNCVDKYCKYTVAYTIPHIKNSKLQSCDILFFTNNNKHKYFSEVEIYNTAIHEIAHALGVFGHSESKKDVLYMTSNALSNDRLTISQVDINTIKLLYDLIPDITDKTGRNTGVIYPPIIFGEDENINNERLIAAKKYIKATQNLPNGYIDLADVYIKQDEYYKAILTLQKALSLATSDGEKYIIFYNMSIININMKDYKNAKENLLTAQKYNPKANIDGVLGLVYYKLGDIDLAKQTYKNAIILQPDNITDSLNLAILYMKEYNFYLAGKILNQLIKNNPDAINDKRIQKYKPVIFLFK